VARARGERRARIRASGRAPRCPSLAPDGVDLPLDCLHRHRAAGGTAAAPGNEPINGGASDGPRRVAIKTLRTDAIDPEDLPEFLARFKREAQSAGRLSQPHIVTIHEHGEQDGMPYIVMEYITGRDLSVDLKRGVRHEVEEVVRIAWLSRKTSKGYRLLTEAEWEYVARAGTTTAYSTGETISSSQARFGSPGTVTAGSFRPNAFGLYDVHGNVWEWTEDCWNRNYSGAPTDGSAWLAGDCSLRVVRGGGWSLFPRDGRSASRYWDGSGYRVNRSGFRLAQVARYEGPMRRV